MEGIGQTIHVGQQVLMIEVGATVQDHDRYPVADIADVQPLGTTLHETLVGNGSRRMGRHPEIVPAVGQLNKCGL
jgi:hypothetical protein